MQRIINANCLSSRIVGGRPIFYNKLIKPVVHKDVILVIEETSPFEIREIISTFMPRGVILKKGSLVGHTAGTLNSLGIQLAVCKNLPPLPLDSYIVIDGKTEKIRVHNTKENFNKYFVPNSDRKAPETHMRCVYYKGEKVHIKIDSKSVEEIKKGILLGADGTGILRTEWLSHEQKTPPSIDDHYKFYKRAVNAAKPYRLG